MENLIEDVVSVFMQVLMGFAPDYVGDYSFLLTGYAFSCLFIVIIIWTFCHILSSSVKAVITWFNRGG